MREEKIARSVSGALIVLPIVFIPLYLIWGFSFARSVMFYGFGCTAVGIAAGWLLGRRHAALQIAAAALPSALMALAVPIGVPGAAIIRWVMMGLGALLGVWTERRSVASADTALRSGLLLAPLIVLLFVSAFLWFTAKTTDSMTAGVWTLLILLGSLWFAVAIFMLNRLSLRQAAHAGSHSDVPEGARRSGTAGVVIFIAATFVLSGISAIIQALVTAFRAAVGWLIEAFMFLASLLPFSMTQSPGGNGGQEDPFPAADGAASPLAELISNILVALVVLAIVAGIVYGLAKLFPKLWKKLRERLNNLFTTWREDEADYQDRAESLMSLRQALAGAGEQLARFARRFRRRPRIGDFDTNAGKVRFLFREYLHGLIASGRAPTPGATASEIAKAAPALAGAYNRARYAGEEPGDEEVQNAMGHMEKERPK